MEDAGLVVSKASIDKLGTIHEGQSQSPARAIKKIDFSGSPEEVCAKNPPLQYDKTRGKFYREVSWDGGKTKQPMYIEENDPNGYFMINYGEQPWDGALLGGTEAIKSYVEPEQYNTNGTKVALEPAKMDYNWTTASKAAPVRFAKVTEGIKGVVGKEGFQPITDNNQVVAIDVKGQPYINTAQYVLDNTKGLDASSIKALLEIDPKADASKAMSELAKTPEGVKQMEDAGLVAPKKKSTYVKPEVSTTELASKEDIASSAFEKPIWKNTVISKQARADVKFVKEQYGLDIDVLRDNKVKIGNEVFDCGNLDKGEIATAVKVAYEGVEPTWGTKFNTQQFSLAEKIYAKKFQSDYKNRVIKEMPIQIRNEAAEWFDNNFNPKTSLAGNFAERRHFYCYPNNYTKSKAIKFADYSAANAIIEPWVAVRLELLAKKGYEIVVHGRETRDDSVTSDIEVISPSGKVTIVHHTERGVRDMDAILQELTNSQ